MASKNYLGHTVRPSVWLLMRHNFGFRDCIRICLVAVLHVSATRNSHTLASTLGNPTVKMQPAQRYQSGRLQSPYSVNNSADGVCLPVMMDLDTPTEPLMHLQEQDLQARRSPARVLDANPRLGEARSSPLYEPQDVQRYVKPKTRDAKRNHGRPTPFLPPKDLLEQMFLQQVRIHGIYGIATDDGLSPRLRRCSFKSMISRTRLNQLEMRYFLSLNRKDETGPKWSKSKRARRQPFHSPTYSGISEQNRRI